MLAALSYTYLHLTTATERELNLNMVFQEEAMTQRN